MENFKKYEKIRILGDEKNKEIFADKNDEIVIQEKIDGGNFRFAVLNEVLIFGSRTQQLTSDEGEDDNVQKNFVRCIEHVRNNIKDYKKYSNYIFYGECCVQHSLPYDWGKIPPFLGFDIYDIKKEQYLDWKEARNIYEELGLEFVPIIKIVKAEELFKPFTDEDVPKSKYACPSNNDQRAEGVVFKNYSKQIFAKYVRSGFKEKNIEVFGGSKKWATTDEGKVCAMYCSNARIDKCIFKLLDDGKELHMSLMIFLPKMVNEDIWEEHWKEIVKSGYKIDFKDLRKKITNRCLNVLKQTIQNNALNKIKAESYTNGR